ncbi:helix-turn-helix domain-containing protein [Actinokineospora terrae]|uniref:DNA binding domain-containing protein, excisionase family n=1 Tax=Actinokineospora terrae TaxID=155974 RepID=A0A1H9VBU9_9PSEU|nr:helix-turn-helix domain-containing protein [Actinokineospora terrae]SES18707.1 DNA binding domain-containing protein, excisionase family [Actinokineospora terrae]
MEWLSVEQVAEELGLHVRTVRNYVRDGKLKAVRIGKQYRIARIDLDAVTGAPPVRRHRHVEVATTVRVDAISRGDMDRVATLLTAAAGSGTAGDRVRVQLSYDEQRASMTVMLLGGLITTAELLRLVDAVTNQGGASE